MTPVAQKALAAVPAPRPVRAGWLSWLGRGAWAVGDQGLFAASNFLVNVLLARRLPVHEFGAFVLAYAVFQLLGQVYIGMVVEPLQVFGAGKHGGEHLPRYLRTLLRGHWLFAGVGSLLFAVTALALWRLGTAVLAGAFLGLAVAAPFIALSWSLRTACYVRGRLPLAATGGAVNLLLVLLGTQLLHVFGALSVFNAVLVIGFASLVACLWLSVGLRVPPAAADLGVRTIARDHWVYGRWSTGAGLLGWVPTEIFYVVLPIWGSLQDTAALKALMNLLVPALQTQFVLGNLLTPALVRLRGRPEFTHTLAVASGAAAVAFSGYWVVVGVLHEPLTRWLYAGRFVEQSSLLWAFGAVPLLGGLAAVMTSALRALERPDRVFWAAVASGAVAVASLAIVAAWGIHGVAAGRALSALVFLALMEAFVVRFTRQERRGNDLVVVTPTADTWRP